jgi:hypothetical protein
MKKTDLVEIKKNHTGKGLLIENDGYMSISDKQTQYIKESLGNGEWHCPYPFVVDAVFQKFGIKNANGRIYPEGILKKQVALYQQRIQEKRALGECYTPDVLVLTETGWKKMADIKEGENVLTLNVETKEIEIKPVLYKIEYEYDGDMIRIQNSQINDLVTPNHGFPIFKANNFKAFISAEDLMNDGEYSLPCSVNNINEQIIIKSSDITKEQYKGTVMCIEVQNHTFFVKSNGFEHWTKNCNHPSDSTIDLGRISHNIIELHWEGRTLVGKLELNVTQGFVKHGIASSFGDTIANLLLNGYKIGVSSRGVGSVEQKMGQYIVGDDFELICWDVVADPSTPCAYIGSSREELQPYMESKDYSNNTVLNEKINKIKNILS